MTDTDADTPTALLSYDGEIGELYRIFLVNLLLTISTLGIWRFWATTRIRRYLWSRTRSGGVRFEYDGTGAQLFVGFLLAFAMIFGLFVGAALLSMALRPISNALAATPNLVVALIIIVLASGAPFSAQRYRLGHTVWRGIRGGMQGSMIAYGLRSLLYYIAVGLTLAQLLPWASLRLFERRINASSFGTVRFVSHGRPGQLYFRFLVTFVGVLLLGAVVFGAVFAIERPVFALLAQTPSPVETQVIVQRLGLMLIAAYLTFGLGAALVSASYQAAFYRHLTSHTTLGALSFASGLSGKDVLKLRLGNVLILLATFGLGLPVVIHRNARFFTTNLLATGTLDTSALMQNEQRVSRFGEGMFQALDGGAGFT